MNKRRQLEASNNLEELAIAAKEIVNLLRLGQSDEKAYALLYVFRRRVGYIVRSLDLGFSQPNAENTEYADDVIESQVWLHRGD